MKKFKKLYLFTLLFPILSANSIFSDDIAERGGGARASGGHYNEDNHGDYDHGNYNHGDQYRNDARYPSYGYGVGVGGAAVYPAYGYPADGYYNNPAAAFPDDSQENSIYKQNQHPN